MGKPLYLVGIFIMKYLYLVFDKKSYLTKIGQTKNINKRISTLTTANPYLRLFYVSDAITEKELHEKCKDKRVTGEWFALTKEDLFEITNNYKIIPRELKYNNVNKKINSNLKKADVFKSERKLTVRQVIMISEKQAESLAILKQYDVNISQFIRQAIKEKLQREWKTIKEKKERVKLPF